MKTPSIARQAALAWGVFVAVDFLAHVVSPAHSFDGKNAVAWMILANAIIAATLTTIANRTTWRGWRMALALSGIPCAIGMINVVEGVVYLKSEVGNPTWILAFLVLKFALALPLWLGISRRGGAIASIGREFQAYTISGRLWRVIVCDLLYLVLYFVAGVLIFPLVRQFYDTRQMPAVGLIIGLQLVLRGPFFAVMCALLSEMIPGARLPKAVFVGLTFTLISGVAPLIVPNSFLPDAVRYVHLGEVTISNFVFGVLVTLIWSKRIRRDAVAAMTNPA